MGTRLLNKYINVFDVPKDAAAGNYLTEGTHGDFMRKSIIFPMFDAEGEIPADIRAQVNGVRGNAGPLHQLLAPSFKNLRTQELHRLQNDENTTLLGGGPFYVAHDSGLGENEIFKLGSYNYILTPGSILDPGPRAPIAGVDGTLNDQSFPSNSSTAVDYFKILGFKDSILSIDYTRGAADSHDFRFLLNSKTFPDFDNPIIVRFNGSNAKEIANETNGALFDGNATKNQFIASNYLSNNNQTLSKMRFLVLAKELGDTLQVSWLIKLIEGKAILNMTRANTYLSTCDSVVQDRCKLNGLNCIRFIGELGEANFCASSPEEQIAALKLFYQSEINMIYSHNQQVIRRLVQASDRLNLVTNSQETIQILGGSYGRNFCQRAKVVFQRMAEVLNEINEGLVQKQRAIVLDIDMLKKLKRLKSYYGLRKVAKKFPSVRTTRGLWQKNPFRITVKKPKKSRGIIKIRGGAKVSKKLKEQIEKGIVETFSYESVPEYIDNIQFHLNQFYFRSPVLEDINSSSTRILLSNDITIYEQLQETIAGEIEVVRRFHFSSARLSGLNLGTVTVDGILNEFGFAANGGKTPEASKIVSHFMKSSKKEEVKVSSKQKQINIEFDEIKNKLWEANKQKIGYAPGYIFLYYPEIFYIGYATQRAITELGKTFSGIPDYKIVEIIFSNDYFERLSDMMNVTKAEKRDDFSVSIDGDDSYLKQFDDYAKQLAFFANFFMNILDNLSITRSSVSNFLLKMFPPLKSKTKSKAITISMPDLFSFSISEKEKKKIEERVYDLFNRFCENEFKITIKNKRKEITPIQMYDQEIARVTASKTSEEVSEPLVRLNARTPNSNEVYSTLTISAKKANLRPRTIDAVAKKIQQSRQSSRSRSKKSGQVSGRRRTHKFQPLSTVLENAEEVNQNVS